MIYFNILKIRYFSYFVSFAMICLFCFGFFYKKNQNKTVFSYSIEFIGGYQLSCAFEGVPLGFIYVKEFHHQLEAIGYKGLSIRSFEDNHFLLRFSISEVDLDNFQPIVFQEQLQKDIKNIFKDIKFT